MELPDQTAIDESPISRPWLILKQFLRKNEPIFVQLDELRAKGWKKPEATAHFEKKYQYILNAGPRHTEAVYKSEQQTCQEMHIQTNFLSLPNLPNNEVRILDLCMAPGGFSNAALKRYENVVIRGISLPEDCGGTKMLLEMESGSPGQIQCQFLDITMLATELGVSSISESHPEHSSFITNRPYHGESFQLVFCGGQVLLTHELPEHRKKFEALRLRASQLVLALQRIATGGTLVILLRKPDAWDTTQLLYQVSQFSTIELFKPLKRGNANNLFFLVAKDVQPDHQAARAAISGWKKAWLQATFGGPEVAGDAAAVEDDAAVQGVIDEFGTKLIELARPLWKIQVDGLIEKGIAQ